MYAELRACKSVNSKLGVFTNVCVNGILSTNERICKLSVVTEIKRYTGPVGVL